MLKSVVCVTMVLFVSGCTAPPAPEALAPGGPWNATLNFALQHETVVVVTVRINETGTFQYEAEGSARWAGPPAHQSSTEVTPTDYESRARHDLSGIVSYTPAASGPDLQTAAILVCGVVWESSDVIVNAPLISSLADKEFTVGRANGRPGACGLGTASGTQTRHVEKGELLSLAFFATNATGLRSQANVTFHFQGEFEVMRTWTSQGSDVVGDTDWVEENRIKVMEVGWDFAASSQKQTFHSNGTSLLMALPLVPSSPGSVATMVWSSPYGTATVNATDKGATCTAGCPGGWSPYGGLGPPGDYTVQVLDRRCGVDTDCDSIAAFVDFGTEPGRKGG